ncbi:FecR family protein [Peristeroidobacter soli]|jgi:transmembrane sensor|uniref:FecR family protein n=1 Tax=Peristeroidobacter soli TaxID=2497877 RepID=UPI00101E1EF5|nr:FecR domain-containing protein [Peristeroidobacter soli]
MSSVSVDARIMDEAARWVVRLKEDSLSEQDLAAWLAWCESDERHRQAFEDAQSFWQGVGALAEAPDAPSRLQALRKPEVASPPVRRHWMMALAASLAAVGIAVSLYLARQPERLVADAAVSVSRKTLPDGSTVELAAKSAVDVRYTEQQRLLELRPGGEAYFDVQPNPQRPFIVSVGDRRVRAVGTAFNVRSAGDRVIVTVDEGTVEIYRAAEPLPKIAADSMRVSAGNEARWTDENTAASVRATNPARALAWREGRLEYIDEPLAAVLADINRYSHRRVVVEQGAADGLAFTGTVFAVSVDEWLRALPGEFPVQLQPNGESEFRLIRKR